MIIVAEITGKLDAAFSLFEDQRLRLVWARERIIQSWKGHHSRAMNSYLGRYI